MALASPPMLVAEHELEVPLDHADPAGAKITVFAREVADPDGADRPFLVYFEGGPGYEAPRPTRTPAEPGWLGRALKEFRVLLLDQRGTGRSAPVAVADADRLRHFRADSIVRDAEAFREALGVERWSVLGQSFGGFCVTTYLSLAPEGLREAFITGGLPPVGRHVDDVYTATYARVRERTRRYFARYPQDRLPQRDDLVLPSGDRLSARRLAQLGLGLGMSAGAERLHHLLELPPDSPAFLHDVEAATPLARNPIFAVLHEACYADRARLPASPSNSLVHTPLITRDNVPAKVNAVCYFRVIDASRSVVDVEKYLRATSQIAQTTLRSVLGKADLDMLLGEREQLNEALQHIIDEHTDPWGIKVTTVEIKDVEIPVAMQHAMALGAQAERERRAKIIHAEGEYQASQRLRDAADVISGNPAALQLRYMQTLTEIGATQNSTVVFPLPLDMVKPFIEAAADKSVAQKENGREIVVR